ncbi:MAG TPA: multicopper oxidase [Polyangiaceae bacterium]|jgi:spore coat protein A
MFSRRRFLFATSLVLPRACRIHHRAQGRARAGAMDHGAMGGMEHGATMHGGGMTHPPAHGPRPPLHPDTLARFVDPLYVPPVLTSSETRPDPSDPASTVAFYRVAMREALVHVHRDVPPTRMWGYEGSVPGPTFEARSGRGVLVEWRNELPTRHLLTIDHTLCGAGRDRPDVRSIVHVHGAKVPPRSDGYPEDWYTPGRSATLHYPNLQDAATLWYHDHAMGIERLNQYAGLFGTYLIRDEVEDALGLPKAPYEVPLVLSDRLFFADGQLNYPVSELPESPWVSEVYADALLVNGRLYPYFDVERRRYRFRIVNASNARTFYLSFANKQTFLQIGSDQGLLPSPVPMDMLTLAPAERADVLVDFTGAPGDTIVLKSQAFELMQFRLGGAQAPKAAALPAVLRSVPRLPEARARTRTLTLNEYEEPKTHRMLMLLNATRWHEPVTEKPVLDSIEVWRLVNLTEDTHPIHLHLVRFQILDRQLFDADEYLTTGTLNWMGKPIPPPANEAGWKDTVRAEPGAVTRIIVKFEGYAGRYLWHCHILEHAANEMMRPFEVIPG